MVLPREVVVPGTPGRLRSRQALLARQGEVADRDGARPVRGDAPVRVGEGVELFEIAERVSCLPLDPCPQARLQRPMLNLERPRGQRAAPFDRHGEGQAVGDRSQHGDQFHFDWLARRSVRRLPPIHLLPRNRDKDWV